MTNLEEIITGAVNLPNHSTFSSSYWIRENGGSNSLPGPRAPNAKKQTENKEYWFLISCFVTYTECSGPISCQ